MEREAHFDSVGRKHGIAGFTIIEVMLFLAITGALVAALLVTVGGAVSRQRFSDSINSTQAFMQEQINETLNVVNTRTAGSCSGGGNTVIGGGTTTPGSTDCVVLGRALDVTKGDSHITTYPIIGYEPKTLPNPTATGKDLLAQYHPVIVSTASEGYDIAWNEQVASVHNGTAGMTRILLLRSPDSGQILIFAGGTNVQGAIDGGIKAVNICFNTQDLAGTKAMVALQSLTGTEAVSTRFDIPSAEQGALCS